MTEMIDFQVDADGIATITIDIEGRSMNVITPELVAELSDCVEKVAGDDAVRGAVLTSGKDSFLAGADLRWLAGLSSSGKSTEQLYQECRGLQQSLRRVETCGKPFAAAINGTALGGGLEICLACHYRVAADRPEAVLGLPEVGLGLLPGGGGTQRLPRLIGIEAALPLLLQGRHLRGAEALELGIVHRLAPKEQVVDAARQWLRESGDARAPWDKKGFKVPGGSGLMHPKAVQTLMVGTALLAESTNHNYPAPIAILSSVYEGTAVAIDVGLDIETKYFVSLLTDPVARNMTRTLFINKGRADKLARRPEGSPGGERTEHIEESRVEKLGILGAGMMGADSRGFHSRVFGTYIREGMTLLSEGVGPALIENVAKQAGMPVGPLAVSDEVSLALAHQLNARTRKDLGEDHVASAAEEVVRRFVDDLGRRGKRFGKGFYDYPEGGKKRLWPGLAEIFPPVAEQPPVEEIRKRLLYPQALEAVRCMDEGVITDAAAADLGSVLGWGFPPYTGGVVSLIDTVGLKELVADCDRMAEAYGQRFRVPDSLRRRAEQDEPFYPRQD